MDRNSKFLKNSAIYAIGNFASKLLNIALLPIYTVYLSASDFGQIDLYITASSLLMPVVTLQSIDAAYRFMLEDRALVRIESVVTNVTVIYAIGFLILAVLYFPVSALLSLEYAPLYYGYMLATYFCLMIQQIARGLRKNSVYATSGIVITLIQGIVNIALITLLGVGAESLLIAPICASTVGLVYLIAKTNFFKYLSAREVSPSLIRRMLGYSLPLCVHSICWWTISSAGTFLLTYFTGDTSMSGIYAMGNKFVQIMAMLNSIFFLAWQESAVEEYSSDDKGSYYGKMYNALLGIQIGAIVVLLPLVKIYFDIFPNSDYSLALEYIPWLLMVNVLTASISFYSMIFNVVMNTRNVFYSSIAGLFLSLFGFVLLVPRFGITGIIIGSCIGYGVILIWRVVGSRKFLQISLSKKTFALGVAFLAITIATYYYLPKNYTPLFLGASCVAFLFLNRETLHKVFSILVNRCRRTTH